MVNKPKIQGTAFETLTVNKLNDYGFKAKRLAEGGSKDLGDIECENTFLNILPYPKIILEAKHRANLNVHQTLFKSKEKAGGDVILAWKKTKRKGNSKVRVADGERVVYIVDEDLMFKLLKSYEENNAE
jgi:Holliday junction resolvase|tara:strand:- start:1671 stop:2057 length:387 start_codon:yes stop_codon:yes gene_type:complete